MHLASLSAEQHYGTRTTMVKNDPPNLNTVLLKAWPETLKLRTQMQTSARALRVQCAPQDSFFIRCGDDLLIMYRCTEFVVSDSKFHTLGRSQVYEVPPSLARASCTALLTFDLDT